MTVFYSVAKLHYMDLGNLKQEVIRNWPAIITALVAVYGAILSTYTFVTNRREKQRQLLISFSNGFLTYGVDISPPMLFIEVANPGSRTVTVNIPCIKLPDGKSIVFPNPAGMSDVTFPHELKEGKSCRLWIEMKELARELVRLGYSDIVKLEAEVRDSVGQVYRSRKPWLLNLQEWAK